MESIYYKKGKKAKELLNIFKNPYPKGSYENEQWTQGFKAGVYEPMNLNIELPDEGSFIDDFEPLSLEPKQITKNKEE